MIVTPTRELIETGQIREGRHYDFKLELDLDKKYRDGAKPAKERLVDDVVAFLNGDGGHLLIGVREKDGVWIEYAPLSSDAERISNQVQQVIQDNIKPLPTKVEVVPLEVPGGFILDVRIPDHWQKPYQNTISGAFYARTGSRNRVLSVTEIQALFADIEKMEADLIKYFNAYYRDLTLTTPIRFAGGVAGDPFGLSREDDESSLPRLHFGILPRQHYDRGRPRYDATRMSRAAIMAFHGGALPPLKGCSGGFESVSRHERLFVAADWHVLGHVNHPIDVVNGRPDIGDFHFKMNAFLESLSGFLAEEGIVGPYALMLSIENLDEMKDWRRPGLASSVGDSRPGILARINDETVTKTFVAQVRSALF